LTFEKSNSEFTPLFRLSLATAGRGQFGKEPMMEMPESFGDSERSSSKRRTKRE